MKSSGIVAPGGSGAGRSLQESVGGYLRLLFLLSFTSNCFGSLRAGHAPTIPLGGNTWQKLTQCLKVYLQCLNIIT